MKRPTSISLGVADLALLGAVAEVEERSKSQVVRRAVRSYAEQEGISMETTQFDPSAEYPGQGGVSDRGKLAASLGASGTGHATDPGALVAPNQEATKPSDDKFTGYSQGSPVKASDKEMM